MPRAVPDPLTEGPDKPCDQTQSGGKRAGFTLLISGYSTDSVARVMYRQNVNRTIITVSHRRINDSRRLNLKHRLSSRLIDDE